MRRLALVILVLTADAAAAGPASAPVHVPGSASADRRPQPPVYPAAPNTIFVEALAAGAMFTSLNYERRLPHAIGVRAGVGSFSYLTSRLDGWSESSYWALPLTVSYQGVRGRRSSLELGGGAILAVRNGCTQRYTEAAPCGGRYRQLLTAFAGYRRHPEEWGLDFRIGLAVIGGRGLKSRPGDLTWDYEWQAEGAALGFVPALYMSLGGAF